MTSKSTLLIASLFPWLAFAAPGDVQVVEPTQDALGQSLDDLAECRATVTEVRTGTTGSQSMPASSPTGGGTHLFNAATLLSVDITTSEFSVYVDCGDVDGNRGPATIATRSFLGPAAPGVSFQP